jgi:nucleotide-binding universal stress UspA family protein
MHETADEMLQSVVKNSPRPVVVVPERWEERSAVIVAYDGSLQAARTLQAFEAVQFEKASQVHIITIHEDQTEAERRADRGVDYLKLHNITAQRHAIVSPDGPAKLLLKRAKQLNAGLIVMGAYGQPALREFFLGSVTRKLLGESSIPLFLYH